MSTTMDEPVGHLAAEHPSETGLSERVRYLLRAVPWPICGVTLIAALLRFIAIEDVPHRSPPPRVSLRRRRVATLSRSPSMESAAPHFFTFPPHSEQVAR